MRSVIGVSAVIPKRRMSRQRLQGLLHRFIQQPLPQIMKIIIRIHHHDHPDLIILKEVSRDQLPLEFLQCKRTSSFYLRSEKARYNVVNSAVSDNIGIFHRVDESQTVNRLWP